MIAGKIWANFRVKDVKQTREFYSRLGFTPNQYNDEKLASFSFGEEGFVIHFFEKDSQIDTYLKFESGDSNEIIFTLSADSEEEIREWEGKVELAGGSVITAAGRDGLGYFGLVFADPDGHRFNLLLMEKGM